MHYVAQAKTLLELSPDMYQWDRWELYKDWKSTQSIKWARGLQGGTMPLPLIVWANETLPEKKKLELYFGYNVFYILMEGSINVPAQVF